MARMQADEVLAYLDEVFPQVSPMGLRIEADDEQGMTIRLPVATDHLRPGGTVSGPTMMTLADAGMYMLLLSRIGRVPLAVTTSLSINFLRKPGLTDLLARIAFLKLGRRLAVAEVWIRSEGQADPVAHAVVTYSIPVVDQ